MAEETVQTEVKTEPVKTPEPTLLTETKTDAPVLTDAEKAAAAAKAEALKNETPEAKVIREKAEADAKTKAEGEAKTAEEKKAAAEKNDTTKNPLKVDEIVLPDGIIATPEQKTGLSELVNKYGIGRDAVADLLKFQAGVTKSGSEAATAAWDKTQETWVNEIKADAEIGGDKLKPALERVGRMIDAHGDPTVRQVLDDSRLGNHPGIIRMLVKVSALLSEGQLATTGIKPSGGGPKTDADVAASIYDKTS